SGDAIFQESRQRRFTRAGVTADCNDRAPNTLGLGDDAIDQIGRRITRVSAAFGHHVGASAESAIARPTCRPEKIQPPKNVPSSALYPWMPPPPKPLTSPAA